MPNIKRTAAAILLALCTVLAVGLWAPCTSAESAQEVLELSRITYAEALSEDTEGRQAIVWVAQNRVEARGFPKTIHKVLFQRNAFSCTRKGGSPLFRKAKKFTLKTDDPQWQSVVRDVRAALACGRPPWIQGVLFYRERSFAGGAATFDKLVLAFEIGHHHFFRA